MITHQKPLNSFFIGWYAWVLAIFFGMVVLDVVYANLVPGARGAFSNVADFLLFIGFVAFVSALIAIPVAWKSRAARTLLIASLLMMAFEFSLPLLLSPFISTLDGLGIGPWLRLVPTGTASVLALTGMAIYSRQR